MSATLDQPAPSARRWIYADLEHFDESERYEIYDGKLISMSPAPSFYHQKLLLRLAHLISSFLDSHPLGELAIAPIDVVFSDDNTAQPDLLFFANGNTAIIKTQVFGAPDLAIEILSPSSITRDRHEKLEQYARFGVKEYWIVDPANRAIEILTLRDGRYVVYTSVVGDGEVSSLILSGFTFKAEQIF